MARDNGSFVSEAGATYYFAVETMGPGPFRALLASGSPVNDLFADAITLEPNSSKVEVFGSGLGSTLEAEEPNTGFGGSIWYKWTPSASGRLHVTFSPQQFPTVRAFRVDGPSLKDLVPVDELVAGNLYALAVYGYEPFHLWIEIEIPPVPPANDSMESAIPLQLTNGIARITGTTVGATADIQGYGLTVWYQWTPESIGTVVADISPLADISGWYASELLLAFALPSWPWTTYPMSVRQLPLAVSPGQTYYIGVADWSGSEGPFELTLTRLPSPANDNFAGASELSTRAATTAGSTLEPGEPHPPGVVGSIWYTIHPSSPVRLFAEPPDSSTTWCLYRGDSLDTLEKVDPPELVPGSVYRLCFYTTATSGTTFSFAPTFLPITGNTNDFFANATVLTGVKNLLRRTSAEGASLEPSEPIFPTEWSPIRNDGSLWWRYTAPASGWLIMAGNNFSVLYLGSSLTGLTPMAIGPSATPVTAGQSFYIQLPASGQVELEFSAGAENDSFSQATDLAGLIVGEGDVQIRGHTAGATSEPGEPPPAGGKGTTVWYRWTPHFAGDSFVSLEFPSSQQAFLTVFKGASLDSLEQKSTGPWLNLVFNEGETLYFQVDSMSDAPADKIIPFILRFSVRLLVPLNDNFANASLLVPGDFPNEFYGQALITRATLEPNEPVHMSVPHKSLWWRWSAPATGVELWIAGGRQTDGPIAFSAFRGGPTVDKLTQVMHFEGNKLIFSDPVLVAPFEEIYLAIAVPANDEEGLSFRVTARFTSSAYEQSLTFLPVNVQTEPVLLEATASSGLPVHFDIMSGSAKLGGPLGNALVEVGEGPITVRASQAGDGLFFPAPSVTQTFVVHKYHQTLSFEAGPFSPVSGEGGTASGSYARRAELIVTTDSNLPLRLELLSGNATLNDRSLTVLGPGDVVVRATQEGNDLFLPASVERVFPSMIKYPQAIQFAPLADVSVLTPSINLNAVASSGLPVAFVVLSGSATLQGATLLLNGVGPVTIRASQTGSDEFEAAANVDRSFVVTRVQQMISLTGLSSLHVGEVVHITANASSGLPVSLQLLSGPGELTGDTFRATGAGTVVLRGVQSGSDEFEAASVDRSFVVTRVQQTISLTGLSSLHVGEVVHIIANASSGLPVAVELLSGPGDLSGDTLRATGVGTVVLRGVQTGSDIYEPVSIDREISVAKTSQSIQFAPIADRPLGSGALQLNASASSGLPVTFTVIAGDANVADSVLNFVRSGTITVRASQAGNDQFEPAIAIERSFEVTRRPQTIEFAELTPVRIGDELFVSATSSSGLPVSVEVLSGPAQLQSKTLTIAGAGEIVIQASQPGDGDYLPANSLLKIQAGRKLQTVEFDPPSTLQAGASLALSGSASSGLPIRFAVVSGPGEVLEGNQLSSTGLGTIIVEARQDGNGLYEPALQAASILVSAPATVSVSLAEEKFILSWQGIPGGVELQVSTDLSSGWTPLVLSELASGRFEVQPTNRFGFFRLKASQN